MARMTRYTVPSRIERPWTSRSHLGTGTVIVELNGGQVEARRISVHPRHAAMARTYIFALPWVRHGRWLRPRHRG